LNTFHRSIDRKKTFASSPNVSSFLEFARVFLPPPIVSLNKESLKPKICTPLARKGKKTRAKSKRSSLHNNEMKTKTQKKRKGF
jgi:hypothetical protein